MRSVRVEVFGIQSCWPSLFVSVVRRTETDSESSHELDDEDSVSVVLLEVLLSEIEGHGFKLAYSVGRLILSTATIQNVSPTVATSPTVNAVSNSVPKGSVDEQLIDVLPVTVQNTETL